MYKDPRGNTLGRGTEIVMYLKEDAKEYIEWHNKTDDAYTKKTNLEIEFRVGEHTRCSNYCSVADFCKQKKEREQ